MYTGNYAQFERERALSLALQHSAYVKQQKQIAHLRSYIDRFRAKATKARQAQSRIKALERMELIAAAHVDSPFSFEFPATDDPRATAAQARSRDAGLRRQADSRRRRLGGAGRRADRAPRAQRRGQVHAVARDRRRARAHRAARAWPRKACRSAISPSIRSSSFVSTKAPCGICSRSSRARASRRCATFSAASIFAATGSTRRCANFPAEKRRA